VNRIKGDVIDSFSYGKVEAAMVAGDLINEPVWNQDNGLVESRKWAAYNFPGKLGQ